MNKSFTRDIFHSFKIIALAAVLALGVSYASAAWTAPTATPPNNNVDQPINVGSVSQVKAGGLGVTNLVADSLFSTGKSTAKEFCIDADGLGPIAPSCFSGYPTGGCTGSQEFTTPGTYTFIIPSCVTATTPLYLTAVGGGGGGGGALASNSTAGGGGGGGGGGVFNKPFYKAGGTVLEITVGVGGPGAYSTDNRSSQSSGSSGSATVLKENSTVLFSLGGGKGGYHNVNQGNTTLTTDGGAGGDSINGNGGAGGGYGAHSTNFTNSIPSAHGTNGSTGGDTSGNGGSGSPGAAGGSAGLIIAGCGFGTGASCVSGAGGGGSALGVGGAGGNQSAANGAHATNKGAGGGGGGAVTSATGTGGNGGNGYVKITW